MRASGVWATLALLGACARLPEIGAGECGNGVIEAPEDCDTFGATDGDSVCRPKGSVGECHLDCTPDREGNRPTCPAGWGCDGTGLCRKPTGEFEPLREYELGSAVSLASGDFDGDGREDVMSLEAPDGLGSTRARFHYFDALAELRESREYSRLVFLPQVADLSRDGRSDVIFSDARIGVLLGRADRSWVPETFSSYRLLDTSIRTLGVIEAPVQNSAGFVVFATFGGTAGVYVTDSSNLGMPRLLGELSGPNEALAGDPVSGHVIEDRNASPCAQVVFAVRGETQVWMLDVCTRDASTGAPAWREAQRAAVPLNPPEPVDAAPMLADVNGDGHLDVLVGANGRVQVAYGDGATLAAAAPLQVVVPQDSPDPQDIEMPLAAGDVTGDGVIDFMFHDHGLFTIAATPGANPAAYVRSLQAEPGHWSAAAIADFNATAGQDLAVASTGRSGVDFFNSSGDGWLTQFRVTTARPIQHFAVGDFNGDFISDLGLSQIGAQSAQADSVLVAYGAPAGGPAAAVQVASLPAIEQISTFREGPLDHMVLSSSDVRNGQRRGVLTLLAGGVGNELPVALYELTRFAADSSTLGSNALRAVGGHFTGENQGDVLAIASPSQQDFDSDLVLEFWLLPALTTDDGSPVLLEGRLPENMSPILGSGVEATLHLSVRAADFDADGRDDVALVAPANGGAHCGLLVLGVEQERMVERASFVVEEPCHVSELVPFDADSDGYLDLALLAGAEGFAEGRLSVFWNDGAGSFDAQSRSLVAGPDDPPVAFAPFEPTPARAMSFMYATASHFHLSTRAENGRDFIETREPAELVGCTGMTALDLDGDGVRDLALATSGNLSVLKALLENL